MHPRSELGPPDPETETAGKGMPAAAENHQRYQDNEDPTQDSLLDQECREFFGTLALSAGADMDDKNPDDYLMLGEVQNQNSASLIKSSGEFVRGFEPPEYVDRRRLPNLFAAFQDFEVWLERGISGDRRPDDDPARRRQSIRHIVGDGV